MKGKKKREPALKQLARIWKWMCDNCNDVAEPSGNIADDVIKTMTHEISLLKKAHDPPLTEERVRQLIEERMRAIRDFQQIYIDPVQQDPRELQPVVVAYMAQIPQTYLYASPFPTPNITWASTNLPVNTSVRGMEDTGKDNIIRAKYAAPMKK